MSEDDIFVDMPPEETLHFTIVSPEKYAALVAERDRYKAALEEIAGAKGLDPQHRAAELRTIAREALSGEGG